MLPVLKIVNHCLVRHVVFCVLVSEKLYTRYTKSMVNKSSISGLQFSVEKGLNMKLCIE